MRLLRGNSGLGQAFSGVGDILYLEVLVLDADAVDTFFDAGVSAGLLSWADNEDFFIFAELLLFP